MVIAWAALHFFATLTLVGAAGWLLWLRPLSRPASPKVAGLLGLLAATGAAWPFRRNLASLRKLRAAGYRQPLAESAFYGIKFAAAATTAALVFAVTISAGGAFRAALLATAAAVCAALLPNRVVVRRVRRRRGEIEAGLPALLDLVVLGLGGGRTIDDALAEAGRTLRRSHPALADELAVFQRELQTGVARHEALSRLGERSGSADLRRLAALLGQAHRFGGSLTPALRKQGRAQRRRLQADAEEQAHKVSVKLVFPIFFLILPAVLVVAVGPAALSLLEHFHRFLGQP